MSTTEQQRMNSLSENIDYGFSVVEYVEDLRKQIARLKEENERLRQHVRDLDHDLNASIDDCNKHHAEGGY